MNIDHLDELVEQALLRCLSEVPFVRIRGLTRAPDIGLVQLDLLVEIDTPQGSRTLAVEAKRSGEPRLAREAAHTIFRYVSDHPGAYGVFAAPYISPRGAEVCSEQGIGYVDLAGNCRLAFGQTYIRREGNDNPFARKRDLRSLYSPKAARVLRVLLVNPQREWKLKDLSVEASVSLGQVHNVKELLANREWIRTTGQGIALASPRELLADWAAVYDPDRSKERLFYTLSGVSEFEYDLAEACRGLGIRCALTGFSGAARFAAFVRYQRATAYVDAITDDLVQALGLKLVPTGANVSLLLPYDEGVYYGSQVFSGVPVVSPVQVYLDLRKAHGRAQEAASKLSEEVIGPRWKQAV